MKTATVSAIIITKNAEKSIGACLESLSWVDEIVVVDAFSSDATAAVCKTFGAKVHTHSWGGYGSQKNIALSYATGEWILSIDADERVSSSLQNELLSAVASPGERVAFEMPRLSSYCGRDMRHSGWWPDHVLRLFRRGQGTFNDVPVHERLQCQGSIGRLRSPLLHDAYANLSEVLQKIDIYSDLGAGQLHAQGRKATIWTALGHGVWTFIRTYFLRAGFLDGTHGLMLAVSSAEHSYYKYAKLCLLVQPSASQFPQGRQV